jgi:putative membrane protein
MLHQLPYCGIAPLPGELLSRFNLDPVLMLALALLLIFHLRVLRKGGGRGFAAAGWLVAAAALLSPLCALSVSLFTARVAQHMLLALVAAPLIAIGMPKVHDRGSWPLWASGVGFLVALWFWHMPVPYDETFASTPIYWLMHITLFGSAVFLWRELLHHSRRHTAQAIGVGMLTSMQMGLLGAVLALSDHPLFFAHLTTAQAWGLTALQDQQLGGIVMWVPGVVLFLWMAVRSMGRLWRSSERAGLA